MRSAISSTSFSLWVMKMIDFPSAWRLRMIPNSSCASCGVRTAVGSSRMRIVGAAIERLQDLDALLLADGDVVHERAWIDREAELLRELLHAPLRPTLVEEDPVVRLDAEHDVLGHRHHRDEHEVLVHHPDAGLDRVTGRAEVDRLPVQQDLAAVAPVEPVQDVHQRGLAGAVLAEQCVHLAAADVEADVVIGDDAREDLADPSHLEHDLGRSHAPILNAEYGKGGHEARPFRQTASRPRGRSAPSACPR